MSRIKRVSGVKKKSSKIKVKSLVKTSVGSHEKKMYTNYNKSSLDKIVDTSLNYQQSLNYRPANTFDKYALLFLGAALIGMIMIGSSMTGYVVSESCCFPPNCAQENLCRVANLEHPAVNETINRDAQIPLVGFVLLASSLFFFIGYARKHHH